VATPVAITLQHGDADGDLCAVWRCRRQTAPRSDADRDHCRVAAR
jgi:hypothetical protein